MKDGGRLAAAIEVLGEVATRHRPVQVALRDWGAAHRFAGSGDRTIIGNLVFDALRNRLSLAAQMASDSPRALVLATYALVWNMGTAKLADVIEADRHSPDPLTDAELEQLGLTDVAVAPHEAANVPEWLWPQFVAMFGEAAENEGKALATRAPVDLRVNGLKSNRDKVLKRLAHTGANAASLSPFGIRIAAKPGLARMPHVQAEEGYQKGWFELQDEASQIAALIAGARPGEQVLDYCAGGGGKTLALAASMENKGQIYAYDADRLRLAPIHDRLKRAGARNVQVMDPASATLDELTGQMDLVFIDAPCTGTGVWRRRPDSKWRLTEKALEDRIADQRAVLAEASKFVKPGGRLAYITCSVLPAENQDQADWFQQAYPDFVQVDAADIWNRRVSGVQEPGYKVAGGGIVLSPASTGTDGFYISMFDRST